MGDLIYRDEAIMAINDTENGMLSQWDIGRNSGLNYAMRKLKELPPAQPVLTCKGCKYDYYEYAGCRNCLRRERDLYEPE